MLDEINIRHIKDNEGYDYVCLMDLTWHFMGVQKSLYPDYERITQNNNSVNEAFYYQGQLDAIGQIVRFLAEAGMAEIFNTELETL